MRTTSGILLRITGSVSAAALMHASAALAAPSEPAAPAKDTGGVVEEEEIVVTARKRSEALQSVPQAVSALTESMLSDLQAKSVRDFAALTPGVNFQTRGAGDLISIRGITTGGLQLGSAIGVYVDEVPIGESSSFGNGATAFAVNLFDLQRVEVLNGPQGTLYGAGSLGGTIKYITNVPDTSKFGATAEAELSTTDHAPRENYGLRGQVNVPFGDGRGAFRVSGFEEYTAGYSHDPVYGRRNLGANRKSGGRASLFLTPTDNFSIQLTALTQKYRYDGGNYGFYLPTGSPAPGLGSYGQAIATEQFGNGRLTLYSAVANWDLKWATLTSVTGYQKHKNFSRSDQTASLSFLGSDLFVFDYDTSSSRFTQELRLASNQETRFNWLVGLYYDDEHARQVGFLRDLSVPDGTFVSGVPILKYTQRGSYRELAVFGNGTLSITDRLDLTVGMRYSKQHQTFNKAASGLFSASGSATTVTDPEGKTDQGVATFLINPRYRINKNVILYARAASGFRPGGPNLNVGNDPFQADKLWNFELGEKATLFNNRATLNASVFDIEWSDIQLTYVNSLGLLQFANGERARSTGAEVSFSYRLLNDLDLAGSVTYTNAKLLTAQPELGVVDTGARLPLSPRFSFALVGSYKFRIGGDYSGAVTVSDRYVGGRNAGFSGGRPANFRLRPYNTVDVNLAIYAPRGVEFDLYVKNVFNTKGQLDAVTTTLQRNAYPVTMSQPFTAGVALKLRK